MSKFIQLVETRDTGKTKVFQVRSVMNGSGGSNGLGEVKWFAPWRRYAFFPTGHSLFDASCLKELTEQLESLMAGHKAKKAEV